MGNIVHMQSSRDHNCSATTDRPSAPGLDQYLDWQVPPTAHALAASRSAATTASGSATASPSGTAGRPSGGTAAGAGRAAAASAAASAACCCDTSSGSLR